LDQVQEAVGLVSEDLLLKEEVLVEGVLVGDGGCCCVGEGGEDVVV
jgi:hypothetical protein